MIKFISNIDLKDYTLIVPAVSVGNVGQLAADLLISTLRLDKVGVVWDPAIIPVVGGDPYNLNSKSLMASCELYANTSKQICILQLRSPLVKKYTKDFLSGIIEFGKKQCISKVVILTSSFASERHSMTTVPFRYLSNDFSCDTDKLKQLEWIDYAVEQENRVIHGGGFALKMLELCTEMKFPCIVLFKYCSEGDNIPDAVDMLIYLNGFIKISDAPKFDHPPSWKLLFGNPPPLNIY